jgi:hypothetical protein
MPYLKLTSKKDSKLGAYPAMEISGVDMAKNEEWTKKFFKGKNNTHLEAAMDDIDVGDEINVVMEQDPKNAKWWNIKEITLMTEEDKKKLETKQSFSKGGASKAGGSVGATSFRRVDGGSRGDDTNRSAAIYLARELVKMSVESMQGAAVPSSPENYARECIEVAELFIYPYIKDGTLPTPEEESALPKKELKVPKV